MSSAVLSFIIVAALVVIIGVLLTRSKKPHSALLTDVGLEQEVHSMLEHNENKTSIVKFVRQKTGAGLLEAKQFVDRIEEKRKS